MHLVEVFVVTNLSTLTDALKRELAVPGTFDDTFPDTTNSDLLGALADGFAEAQLYGFFKDSAINPVPDTSDWTVTPDMSAAGGALVVIYASIRSIRAQLRNLNTLSRYKAGSVEYEVQKAASVLTAELAFLSKRLDDILESAAGASRASAGLATVFDGYLARDAMQSSWCGFYAHEWR